MALSKSPVVEEFEKALGQMVSMQAALGTIVMLLVLLAMPEPVTKALAAWGTAGLIIWVGASTQQHHMATIANKKSALRGGPWTPRFEELFARAGLRMKDRENVVPIPGHKGPHPQRYHDIVYRRLDEALGDCPTIVDCRVKLTRELRALSDEVSTPGTELNRLVTLGKSD